MDKKSAPRQACLKELKEQCLYLHYDGVRYCFKKDPNVTLLVEQEADSVARDEARVRNKIREMIEERMGGDRTAIVWPPKSGELPDRDPSFLVAYMPFECGTKGGETREAEVIEYFARYGNKPRDYRNGVGVAVPAEDQIEILRRSVRYLLAIEQVRGKGKQLNLTDAQKDQLKEREATERTAAESALLKLYAEVWLPVVDGSGVGIEKVAAGGRPLVTTLDEKKRAAVHKRVVELLTDVQRKVFTTVQPSKIVELFKLGDGAQGLRTSEMVDGFYSFLGYPRLMSDAVVRRAIVQGVLKGLFGYTTGTPPLGSDARFLIDRAKVAFERVLQEDEVDVQSGFLMAPAGILPQPLPRPASRDQFLQRLSLGGNRAHPAPAAERPCRRGQISNILSSWYSVPTGINSLLRGTRWRISPIWPARLTSQPALPPRLASTRPNFRTE